MALEEEITIQLDQNKALAAAYRSSDGMKSNIVSVESGDVVGTAFFRLAAVPTAEQKAALKAAVEAIDGIELVDMFAVVQIPQIDGHAWRFISTAHPRPEEIPQEFPPA